MISEYSQGDPGDQGGVTWRSRDQGAYLDFSLVSLISLLHLRLSGTPFAPPARRKRRMCFFQEASMPLARRTSLILLCFLFVVGPVRAQQSHVVQPNQIDQALADHRESTQAKRQTIRTALQQSEVQRVAKQLGLDVARAESAIATLSGADLDRAAAQAQAVNDEIAGGQTVRLNLLWIIIALLVIILIIVAS